MSSLLCRSWRPSLCAWDVQGLLRAVLGGHRRHLRGGTPSRLCSQPRSQGLPWLNSCLCSPSSFLCSCLVQTPVSCFSCEAERVRAAYRSQGSGRGRMRKRHRCQGWSKRKTRTTLSGSWTLFCSRMAWANIPRCLHIAPLLCLSGHLISSLGHDDWLARQQELNTHCLPCV